MKDSISQKLGFQQLYFQNAIPNTKIALKTGLYETREVYKKYIDTTPFPATGPNETKLELNNSNFADMIAKRDLFLARTELNIPRPEDWDNVGIIENVVFGQKGQFPYTIALYLTKIHAPSTLDAQNMTAIYDWNTLWDAPYWWRVERGVGLIES